MLFLFRFCYKNDVYSQFFGDSARFYRTIEMLTVFDKIQQRCFNEKCAGIIALKSTQKLAGQQ